MDLLGYVGVIQTYKDLLSALKMQMHALILEKLCEVAQLVMVKMFYVNFNTHITEKMGIVIKGWPLKKFCSPSDINSTMELQVLYNAWKSGTTHFSKMSTDKWRAWGTSCLTDT
ncbi:hypothetical protein JVU11DRAFT_7224 [Chiua virens]|nr:hypothetical protein JVU11DRAFT_7224 [Chiua virens]